MSEIIFYHNPNCSKSRATLAIIQSNEIRFELVHYLENTPSIEQIKTIVKRLGFSSARQLMRKNEAIYKTLGLENILDEAELLNAMHQNPILIERPILVVGSKAKIGRPPEAILEILGS